MLKTSKCKLCDKPAFSKGYCQQHSPKKSIRTSRQKTLDKKVEIKEIRDVYFEYHILKCSYSEHSNTLISNPSKTNICHLYDKSRHPSLQANLDNYIYLQFSEHDRLDKLLYSHEFYKLEEEFGKTWDLICFRILKIVHLCKENTVFTRAIKKYLDERAKSI